MHYNRLSNATQLNNFVALHLLGEHTTRAKKRQVCFRIEESLVQKMEQIRDQTGVSLSTQIEMRLKGFAITRNVEKKGSGAEILRWYQNLTKDEEYADNVEEAIGRMQELKLHWMVCLDTTFLADLFRKNPAAEKKLKELVETQKEISITVMSVSELIM